MKSKGRLMLFLMLVLAVGLSFVALRGIGADGKWSAAQIKQGLDLSGGVYIVYEADKENVTQEEMNAAVSLIQGRLDWNGWTEAEVAQDGSNRIRVDIPGVENAEEAIREIGQTAQLAFKDEAGNVLLTGDMVVNATKQVGATSKNGPSEPYVALEFSEEGKQLFAEATKANIGKTIQIVMDDNAFENGVKASQVENAVMSSMAALRLKNTMNPVSIEVKAPDRTDYTVGDVLDRSGGARNRHPGSDDRRCGVSTVSERRCGAQAARR